MITPKERLIKVLNKENVDRPPVICPGGMMNMITSDLMEVSGVYLPEAHTDPRLMANLAKAVYDEEVFENVGVPFCMTVEAEGMGAKCTLGTNIFEPHVTEYKVNKIEEWEISTPIDLEKGRAKVVLDSIKILKDEVPDLPIVGNLSGPISVASSVMEPNAFYKSLIRNKEEAHKFMDFTTKELIKFAKAEIAAGANIIAISEPSGTGEIMGPRLFKEYVVHYLNLLLDGIREEGIPTVVHICGQMRTVYDQLKTIKADALSFDSIVSLKKVREYVKEDMVLMGNVSTYSLEFGSQDQINAITKSSINQGSNILSPACGIGMKSPLGNIKEILKTAKELSNVEN